MTSKARLALLLAPLMLAGCSTSPEAPHLGADFGEAVKYNAAIQVNDPDPVYPASAVQAGARGDMGAAAVKRLRTDKVKEPQTDSTQSSGGSSGSSSGSGSGAGPR
ncbi:MULTISPECIES: hypothetical protein [Sphingomonas]|uniref:hypothetical protein n=1 Tax=Sphingomonas TaxID=13687 RepID=UPI000DEF392E|nr:MULTISPECIES: hypothetical protein [Sphingomonas]